MGFFNWLRKTWNNKLSHFKWDKLKAIFKEHGLALIVIIVGWEIVEDVVFPLIFAFLGNYVHPSFYAGIPAAWIVCLHWFMVPLLWGAWMKIKGVEKDPEKIEAALKDSACCDGD